MSYFVIGPDGKAYGPAEISMLQQWVSEGRVVATTMLQAEGSDQQVPASSVPELGLAAAAPVMAAPQPQPQPQDQLQPEPQPLQPAPQPQQPYQPQYQPPAQPYGAPVGGPVGGPQGGPMQANTSGMGSAAVVPAEIRGWNWGAFWFTWLWAVNHRTWIGLIALVSMFSRVPGLQFLSAISLIIGIILGIKGNEWAWQNRRWESVEQFRRTQRVWAWWALGCFLAVVVIVILAVVLAAVATVRSGALPKS